MTRRDRGPGARRRGGPWELARPACRSAGRLLGAAAFAAAVLAVAAVPARSQIAPSLEAVDSLTRAGLAEEAREVLTRWMAQNVRTASRQDQQRAIWLRGVLTVDPSQAALDFQRLAVEFPGGPWTDDALLRLARYAEAAGDPVEAARHYAVLARDHGGSAAGREAGTWLDDHPDAVARAGRTPASRSGGNPSPASAGSPVAGASGPATPPPDTLGRERVARPTPAGPRPDTAAPPGSGSPSAAETRPEAARRSPPPPSDTGAEPAGARGDYTVQLGAFSTESRARALMGRLRDAGFEPRLVRVPGSDLLRVRAGRFTSEAAARTLLDRIVAGGFEALVAADAGRETPAG